MEKVSLESWVEHRDGVMHSESGDNDGDDDEPVKDEMTMTVV